MFYPAMTKEHILQEIRRTAEANGGVPLGSRQIFKETGIRASDWKGRYWARWSEAIGEAGYIPNKRTDAYDESLLLGKYSDLVLKMKGQLPADADLRMETRNNPQFPSASTFSSRYGTKIELIKRLLGYCKPRPEYEVVVCACEEYLQQNSDEGDNGSELKEAGFGFVYLIKSGRNYKIGRSNATGRREYELAIQLPEKATKVHEIRTDDPVGIEEYWHKRFQAKRKNGEWFDLNAVDISAFKRRKFM